MVDLSKFNTATQTAYGHGRTLVSSLPKLAFPRAPPVQNARFLAAECGFNPPVAELPVNTREKTAGLLHIEGQDSVPLLSGVSGPSHAVRGQGLPGFNGNQLSHVEGHAAAYMRVNGIQNAVLDINKLPCTQGSGGGCQGLLQRMLPEGASLRVRGPGGYNQTFTGLPDN
jgi:hypothetical protein